MAVPFVDWMIEGFVVMIEVIIVVVVDDVALCQCVIVSRKKLRCHCRPLNSCAVAALVFFVASVDTLVVFL